MQNRFLYKNEGRAVCTVAITDDNKVIMARQYRPGPEKVLLEIPGGYVDEEEDPVKAAERELLEETGYSGEVKFVTETFECAYSDMNRYCMVATNCKKVAEAKLDLDEFAEVVLVSLDEFREILRSGQMTDIEVGYLCLDYLGLL